MKHHSRTNLRRQGLSRRHFLKLMGASMALAGMYGCTRKPDEKIVPYVNPPEQVIPGRPMFFATAMPIGGFGLGVLVQSNEGRPTKVEGNPDHPGSLGATNVFMQASVLGLYDPDRSREVTRAGVPTDWGAFLNELRPRLQQMRSSGGTGLAILAGQNTSPSFQEQRRQFHRQFPAARWYQYEPVERASSAIYRLEKAKVIVSLDSDFLFALPGSVAYARHFTDGRRVRRNHMEMNRLYVAESALTITGSMADHRMAVRSGDIQSLTEVLAAECGVAGANRSEQSEGVLAWIRAAANDLKNNAGDCLVIAGEPQPAVVHERVHAINQQLGNTGKTISYTDPVDSLPVQSLGALVQDMQQGWVDTLIIFGGNAAYNAPADVPFAQQLARLTSASNPNESFKHFTAHLGLYNDDTSFLCQWHLPESHYLESWGDVRTFDGAASIIQPLIAPLYASRSSWEVMEMILGRPDRRGYEIVREYWQQQVGQGDFERWWENALQKGIASPAVQTSDNPGSHSAPHSLGELKKSGDGLEIVFRPDPTIWDGSFANNPWLQELPKPFTKLTWGSAAYLGPATARQFDLNDQDMIRISYRGRTLEVPVLIVPGQAEQTITLFLGHGQKRAGSIAAESDGNLPINAYALRTSDAPWFGTGATITKLNRNHRLVTTRNHHAMSTLEGFKQMADRRMLKPDAIASPTTPESQLELDNRKLVRTATLQQFMQNPDCVKKIGGDKEKKPLLSLYPGWDYSQGHQWGMSIDMTACIGCNACVVACQAENNIPVVGKTEVQRMREMHWIRIDDYFTGHPESPQVIHQPVPCQHCENAPCELVCPVGATTHSAEGINEMTYNRCVGTRYCSNNCPYKVRRFNFFPYADRMTKAPLDLQRNPDVTVRAGGVMEKCNYCIQRINRTRMEIEKMQVELSERARLATDPADQQQLKVRAGELQAAYLRRLETACQQACPTQAIVFGDINQPGQEVVKLKAEPTDYTLLAELTTKPRTSYMARITNPNPALETGGRS